MSDRSGVAPWRGLSSVHRQFLGYLLSGGLSTAIDLIVFRGLLFLLAPMPAFLTSYVFCLVLRYFWDAQVTFRQSRVDLRGLLRYLTITGALMGIGLAIFHAALTWLSPMPAKLCSLPVTIGGGFLLTRRFVFRGPVR